ncbi:MAG: hypothetical protein QOH04_2075 [Sphingomonadales bacterium]|jgi:hypothetical protein|nr:hypothetical protein [Sphingomonadales bacterium]MEA3036310.1 hypothetical protein [Sphingomonadales bacterium]
MQLVSFGAALLLGLSLPALAQTGAAPGPGAIPAKPAAARPGPPDPMALMAAERQAMGKLAMLDGAWRGSAWTITPRGKVEVTHTERVGLFLAGTVRMIEGRSYSPNGTIPFVALGIISFNPANGTYRMRSYAQGMAGDFAMAVTPDGYAWEVPAGPGAVIRYRAAVSNGAWKEVGFRVADAGAPVQVFEMNLKRIGETRWPVGEPVPMR